MPLNIENAESAFLAGYARFEGWRARFEGRWYEPIAEMQRKMLVASLPEPVKAELRKMVPGGMAMLEGGEVSGDQVAGGQGRGYKFGGMGNDVMMEAEDANE